MAKCPFRAIRPHRLEKLLTPLVWVSVFRLAAKQVTRVRDDEIFKVKVYLWKTFSNFD